DGALDLPASRLGFPGEGAEAAVDEGDADGGQEGDEGEGDGGPELEGVRAADLGPACLGGRDDGAFEPCGGGESALVVGLVGRDLLEELRRDLAPVEDPGAEDAAVPRVGVPDQVGEAALDPRAEAGH